MWADPYGCQIQRTGSSGSYTYSVEPEWANRPVNYVSWGDAARFVNWLSNGQPTGAQEVGTTEVGSYYLNGATSDGDLQAVSRAPNADWVIPSEDEWYKAAYHRNDGVTGNYFNRPMSSDNAPSNDLIDPDPGNSANFNQDGYTIGSPFYRTEVGEFENSGSPYGTFDMGGNVFEWNEAVIGEWSCCRGLRGESFLGDGLYMNASARHFSAPTAEGRTIGFRIALVPEPASLALLAVAGLLAVRRR